MTANIHNERIKRAYVIWLREARGFSDSTIVAIERAISLWEEFSCYEDFAKYNQSKAVRFKEWLTERARINGIAGDVTAYHTLRHLKSFFQWLSTQPGFKSRIELDSVSYLSLDKKKVRELMTPKSRDYPWLEYVKSLVSSIDVLTEIDQRDRALIAFLLLSGMRDRAVATLPLGCFELEKLEVSQHPSKGVQTKFGKPMTTYLWKFDEELLSCVLTWPEHLKKERLFGAGDPLFPRSRLVQNPVSLTFNANSVEPVFWKGSGPIREILRNRASRAGLKYYNPHSFRHAASHLALSYCRTPEDFRAVSQNLGHEYIGTTILTYGRLDQFRVAEVISRMDFAPNSTEGITESEALALESILRKARKSC
jgi:site-specific recombinase XerD